MLISIEGLDGVGKTTIVSNLSKALKIPNIEKPIKSLLELNPVHSKKIKEKLYASYSPSIQAMYYLFGYLSALEQGKNADYILDRGFLSTYYFSYCKENASLFDFFAYNYGFPDLTILLYASIEERIKRILEAFGNKKNVINCVHIFPIDTIAVFFAKSLPLLIFFSS